MLRVLEAFENSSMVAPFFLQRRCTHATAQQLRIPATWCLQLSTSYSGCTASLVACKVHTALKSCQCHILPTHSGYTASYVACELHTTGPRGGHNKGKKVKYARHTTEGLMPVDDGGLLLCIPFLVAPVTPSLGGTPIRDKDRAREYSVLAHVHVLALMCPYTHR